VFSRKKKKVNIRMLYHYYWIKQQEQKSLFLKCKYIFNDNKLTLLLNGKQPVFSGSGFKSKIKSGDLVLFGPNTLSSL